MAKDEWDIEINDGSRTFSVMAAGLEIPEISVGDFISAVGISSLELDPDLKPIIRLVVGAGIVKLN